MRFELLLLFLLLVSCNANFDKTPLMTNQRFIESLYNTDVDYKNTEELFDFVFSQLPDEVVVYPTENYYYFELPLNGKTLAGNIGLPAHERDGGKVYFAHYERVDKFSPVEIPTKFGGRFFDKNDGVIVEKLNDFKYKVSYKGKSIIFNLNQISIDPPKKVRLTKDEIFIGPSFDESGIKFFLLYNNATNRFYWILNDEGFVADNFIDVSNEVFIGERSSFAFYNDSINNRNILIGVSGFNVLNNNWYDGPFDQLPDNYIKIDKIKIQNYLESVYVNARNNIDKYGHFLDNNESRIAISSYLIYFDAQELVDKVEYCKLYKSSIFYTCITPSEDNVNPHYYNYLSVDKPYEKSNNPRQFRNLSK